MFSLVADYETTSSSSSSDGNESESDCGDQKSQNQVSSLAKAKTPPLPSANSLLRGGVSKTTGDVFTNSFLEAEKLEIYKLQKHVKMVDSENHLLQKNGRKICWNNRKGRCRFGNKCKYAHDSDLVSQREMEDANEQNVKKEFKSPTKNGFRVRYTTEKDATSDSKDKLLSSKRPGLGDDIVPGKRVMKTYNNTKKSTL